MISPLLVAVDDEQTSLDLVEDSATNIGFYVKTFTRGFELQNFLQQGSKPALILVDIVMPDIDGIELMLWLAGEQCKIPLIVTSGYDEKYLEEATQIAARLDLNLKAVFHKPIQIHDIEENLESIYRSLVSN